MATYFAHIDTDGTLTITTADKIVSNDNTYRYLREAVVRLPSFSGHPICTDLVSVREDVHCESTAQEVHA